MNKFQTRDYTVTEEISHSAIHAIGSHLGAAMLALMVVFAVQSGTHVAWKVASGTVFGLSIILLYTVSSVYHALTNERAKQIMEIFDHIAIYLLIAGTYTPFTLVTLRESSPIIAWTIFGIVWSVALVGSINKISNTGKWRKLSTLAYILMGWIVLIAVKPLIAAMPLGGLLLLLAGGLLYTLGTVFYLWRIMPFHHAVWHLFVLGGTICHFLCIQLYVMMR
ncbi:MAG: hemolysin III family protein [bacterium]